MPDALQRGGGQIEEDVVRETHGVIVEGDVDLGAWGHKGRAVECEGLVTRLAVRVQHRGDRRATTERLNSARDLGRAVVEGGFAAGDEYDTGCAESELPDLEPELAGQSREGKELLGRFRGGFHGGAER